MWYLQCFSGNMCIFYKVQTGKNSTNFARFRCFCVPATTHKSATGQPPSIYTTDVLQGQTVQSWRGQIREVKSKFRKKQWKVSLLRQKHWPAPEILWIWDPFFWSHLFEATKEMDMNAENQRQMQLVSIPESGITWYLSILGHHRII